MQNIYIGFRFETRTKSKDPKRVLKCLWTKFLNYAKTGNKSVNFGIFLEISGYFGSLLGVFTKLQLATLDDSRESGTENGSIDEDVVINNRT